MTSLSIILDSNQSGECIFRPGQLLKGTTVLTLSNPRKFRGLSIRVFGHARTKFEIQGRRRPQTERGVEVFLNTNIYLFGRQDGPAFELGQGTHKYKFSCQLPEQLPNSTSLKHGTIEYFVEAVLEIPYLLDKEAKAPFIVDCDDLNYCEAISQPVRRVEMRNFSQYESLCTTIMLPCSGFVSNQTIPITIFYENNSSASIVRTKVALVQSIQYRNHDGSEVKSEKYILNENCAEGVTARNQRSVTTSLRINDVPMSITKFCGIISVKYTLEVEPELCANADDDKVYIPITIGKIPMAVTPQMIPIIMPVTPQRPRSIYATAPPPEQLNEELPPSYEELMRLKPF